MSSDDENTIKKEKTQKSKLYNKDIQCVDGVHKTKGDSKGSGLVTHQFEPEDESKMMYFEITLLKASKPTPTISIGFAPGEVDWKSKGHVGIANGGVGWQGELGGVYNDNATVNPTIDKWKVGDTVGACWNLVRDQIFFTKNGQKQKAFLGCRTRSYTPLFPTVVFAKPSQCEYTLNMGKEPFRFDLDTEKDPDDVDDSKPLTEINVSHEQDVSSDLSMFFNSQVNSDIIVTIGDKNYHAHKIILASRSPYLVGKVFTVEKYVMESKFSNENNLLALEYIYTGKSLLNGSNWESVLKCADFYKVAGLRRACFDFMIKSLSKDTVLEVLNKAQNKLYDFDATDLIKRCVKFLEKNAHEIIKTPSFLELSDDVVAMILQNTNSVFDELDAFNACLAWGKYQIEHKGAKGSLEEVLKNVTPHIRYPLLSPSELVRYVKPAKVAPILLYAQAVEYHACPDLFGKQVQSDIQFTKRYKTFSGSSLLDERMAQVLLSFLPFSPKGWECIYKASKDGFNTNTFHSKCDNKGETFVVIKSDNNNVFGGYASQPWGQTNTYTYDTKTFLFSLINKNGKAPCKIANNTNNKHSTYGAAAYGPTFGGGHDLYICNQSDTVKSSYTNLGHSFKLPKAPYGQNEAKNFLAGAYNFLTKEIEVFAKIQ